MRSERLHGCLLSISMTALLAACGGAGETPSKAPASDSVAGAAETSPAVPADASPSSAVDSTPQGPPPTGRVVKTSESKESPVYLHVEIGFDNQSARSCKILGYLLSWPGGKKDISLESFVVPPHDGKTRSVKVHPDDGDLKSLTADGATVTVRSDCGS